PQRPALLGDAEVLDRAAFRALRFRAIDAQRRHLQLQGAMGSRAATTLLGILAGPRPESTGPEPEKSQVRRRDCGVAEAAAGRDASDRTVHRARYSLK